MQLALRPAPRRGSQQRCPRLPSWVLEGRFAEGGEGSGKGQSEGVRERRRGDWRSAPTTQNVMSVFSSGQRTSF